MANLTDSKSYILVDYHSEKAPAAVEQEIRLWIETAKVSFPDLVEQWKDPQGLHFVMRPLDGTLLKNLVRSQDKSQRNGLILALLPPLRTLFQELYNFQVILPSPPQFMSRIFQTKDGKLQLVPSLFFPLLNADASPPLVKSAGLAPLSTYMKAFGELIFVCLTDRMPAQADVDNLAPLGLNPETAKALKNLLLGETSSFNMLTSAAQSIEPPETLSINIGVKRTFKDVAQEATHHVGDIFKQFKTGHAPPGVVKKTGKINLEALLVFSRQMGMLLKNGIAMTRGLEIISQQVEDKTVQKMITEVRQSVESGLAFSEALDRSSIIFPPAYIAMVRSGENAGFLVEAMERLTVFLEKEFHLIKKIKGAMTYPIVMFTAAILIVFGIVKFVFPTFADMFANSGQTLPLITQMVMALVKFLENPYAMLFLGAAAALAVYGFKAYAKLEEGRENLDRLRLRMPIFGKIYLKIASTRFCRTLASLYGNGLPLVESLGLVGEVIGNKIFQKELERARMTLTVGGKVSESLHEGQLFPGPVVYMVALGEETGELVHSLNKIADYYETDVDFTLDSLSSLIEPLIIAVMGLIMGVFMLSVFLPLYQMIGHLG